MANQLNMRLVQGEGSRRAHAHSLDEAFRAYAPYVAVVGMRILGRRSEVDDLVQDVFLRAHSRLPGLRDPGALKAWLTTMTVRMALRRLRRRRWKMLLGLGRDYPYEELADPALSAEEVLMLSDAFRALDELPWGQRLAWSLRFLHDEPLDRVASLCGCSLATAKRWIALAHEAVKRKADPCR